MSKMNAAEYLKSSIEYFEKGDYNRAIADSSEAIRLDPNNAVAYGTRGAAYKGKEDFDSAIADLTEAIRLDPNNAPAYGNRGLTYITKRDYDKAISDLEMAVKIQPENDGYRQFLAKVKSYKAKSGDNFGDKETIIIIIFSIIGLIVGIGIWQKSYWDFGQAWFVLWYLLGIGGNIGILIARITDQSERTSYSDLIRKWRQKGDSLEKAWGTLLAMEILWVMLKSLAGPIFPIKEIVFYKW